MIKEITENWFKNKDKLLIEFKKTHPESYEDILKETVKIILNSDEENYDIENITKIDNGDYQGTILFAIPRKTYQPSEDDYLFTYTGYGSCSGCDALENIKTYDDCPPTDEQAKDYLGLALNLIQRMNNPWKIEDGAKTE